MELTMPMGILPLVAEVVSAVYNCRRTTCWWDGRDRDAPLCCYPKVNSKFRNRELTKSYICLEIPSGAYLSSGIAGGGSSPSWAFRFLPSFILKTPTCLIWDCARNTIANA